MAGRLDDNNEEAFRQGKVRRPVSVSQARRDMDVLGSGQNSGISLTSPTVPPVPIQVCAYPEVGSGSLLENLAARQRKVLNV